MFETVNSSRADTLEREVALLRQHLSLLSEEVTFLRQELFEAKGDLNDQAGLIRQLFREQAAGESEYSFVPEVPERYSGLRPALPSAPSSSSVAPAQTTFELPAEGKGRGKAIARGQAAGPVHLGFSPAASSTGTQTPGYLSPTGAVERVHHDGTAVDDPAGRYSREFRIAVAKEIGRWFIRLRDREEGERLPPSGREKVKLQNRCYVVLKDFEGRLPRYVLVFNKRADCKAVVAPHGDYGDSIFSGFPTWWEAQVAVQEAGYCWPSPLSD